MKPHTKGPWIQTKSKYGIDGGDYCIALVAPDREDRCFVIHAPDGADEDGDANARLILHSPDLAIALRNVVEGWIIGEDIVGPIQRARALLEHLGMEIRT